MAHLLEINNINKTIDTKHDENTSCYLFGFDVYGTKGPVFSDLHNDLTWVNVQETAKLLFECKYFTVIEALNKDEAYDFAVNNIYKSLIEQRARQSLKYPIDKLVCIFWDEHEHEKICTTEEFCRLAEACGAQEIIYDLMPTGYCGFILFYCENDNIISDFMNLCSEYQIKDSEICNKRIIRNYYSRWVDKNTK